MCLHHGLVVVGASNVECDLALVFEKAHRPVSFIKSQMVSNQYDAGGINL
jgi:hypothetical protein